MRRRPLEPATSVIFSAIHPTCLSQSFPQRGLRTDTLLAGFDCSECCYCFSSHCNQTGFPKWCPSLGEGGHGT